MALAHIPLPNPPGIIRFADTLPLLFGVIHHAPSPQIVQLPGNTNDRRRVIQDAGQG
ncbi:hypothetical protein [Methanogenium sp. MK-MG]|uniref:hypothetical protein n=1 Tax=Methanogenium sp. MK-MG TaxID=2599926 RepID=UPI0013ECC30C|nr:hypothetical protein [Methanogenium sp. MK-MG]KAF1078229.1 hypothetical protein MKMG_00886 [Methanogenium sp. MK-MG]